MTALFFILYLLLGIPAAGFLLLNHGTGGCQGAAGAAGGFRLSLIHIFVFLDYEIDVNILLIFFAFSGTIKKDRFRTSLYVRGVLILEVIQDILAAIGVVLNGIPQGLLALTYGFASVPTGCLLYTSRCV